MISHGLAALLGVWLMAAPRVFGHEGGPLEYSDRIAGPLIATFGVVAMAQCTRAVRWANVPLGLWVCACGWALGAGLASSLHGTAIGVAIVTLSLERGRLTHPYGGGWRSLWRPQLLPDASDPAHQRRNSA